MKTCLYLRKMLLAVWGALSLTSHPARAQVTLNIDAGQRGALIGERHYGIFFEEINHAGDGGLYAELISNRSFEDNSSAPDNWQAVNNARMSLTSDGLLNNAQQHALELEIKTAGDGLRNGGFWGIHIVEGQTYKLSFWIKGKTAYKGTLTASLLATDGTNLGSTDIPLEATDQWTRLTAEIQATGEARDGSFALTGSAPGTVVLDVVSLFPPTYKGRDNGCRIDLAEMLEAMNPSFVRFPGGCYVEGVYANGSTNRFEWKKTIGPIEERPGHMNQNWGYRVSDGFGFHEMLQLTEDLGAEPLFVVNMGMGHGWAEDYRHIEEYIQEALDALEYCNGDASTTYWGAKRAENGHPEPFGLRLIEIGNENYNFSSENNSDQSDHYAERYRQFYDAIKARYPEVTVIGNVEAWGTDAPSWRNPHPVDVVDEHYYRNPSWFVNQYNKYDSYSRSNYKIYVGEYAVTQDYGVNGHLNAALGEAVFMLGMENNSDVCVMNSYAPIFVNENNYNWRPDMIRFNSYTSFGTPSYYVQQLLPNNVGKQNVRWTEQGNRISPSAGCPGLSTWSTQATFDNMKLTKIDGTPLFSDDFSATGAEWSANGGQWGTSGGKLHQTDAAMQGSIYVCHTDPGESYIYEIEATKNSGAEGFLIVFNYRDTNNYCWWNLGGWGNTQHGVEVCTDGQKSTVASAAGSLNSGQTYRIRIQVQGTHVQCYLDGALVHDFTLPAERKIYVSSNIDDETGMLYVKMVNPHATSQPVVLQVGNASLTGGDAIVLTSPNGTDENTLENPENVVPEEAGLQLDGQTITYEARPYSLNILRLNVRDIRLQPSAEAELPEPVVQYSFENADAPADDSGEFPCTLQGGASIVRMDDGNGALYTGPSDEGGWLDLGASMARQALASIAGDYTVSVDIALPKVGNLDQYCWAYALADGTDQYIGLVNTPDNTNWYYTIKDSSGSSDIAAGGGLAYGRWHNLTYVQEGTSGRLYVDGRLTGEQEVDRRPADFAQDIAMATLGRSPFSEDALTAEAYFDNFRIYAQALEAEKVAALFAKSEALSPKSCEANHRADCKNLTDYLKIFNYLHATTPLPAETPGGTPIGWQFEPSPEAGYARLAGANLEVLHLPTAGEPVLAGQLTATLLPAAGEESTGEPLSLTHPVYIAPDDNRYGYLYCFMNSGAEITNFALGSQEDRGETFHVLLDGAEIFDTDSIASIEHGTRDAYIGRGEGEDGYFITVTDMKQQASGVWNNRGIALARSADLIHWTGTSFDFTRGKSVFSDPEATTGFYDTDEEYALISRVWAPQFIWDPAARGGTGAYLVYYSILSSGDSGSHDRIFYSYADREFKTLTQPRLLFDPGYAVIDADILYSPYDSLYHLFYKREGASGTARGIYEATSPALVGGTWTTRQHFTGEGSELVEAPTAIRRINEDGYNLYYMRYSGGNAYKYCTLDHLCLPAVPPAAVGGTGSFQHGSVMTLTEEEYTMLQAWDKLLRFLPEVEELKEQSGSAAFDPSLRQAREALALTSVAELAEALPAAFAALRASLKEYAEAAGGEADLTFLLENPDFATGGSGWDGTPFTAANAGVAEFFDTTYDTYQVLEDMPAGTYTFRCQGFYRDGDYAQAYPAHQGGTEQLRAVLYVNDCEQPFLSLFDESTPYTYSPYTYPDDVWTANDAFNRDGQYTANTVEYTLHEQGDLQLGVAKNGYRLHDWNCFDNFELHYRSLAVGVEFVPAESAPAALVDVYTVDGLKVRTGVAPAEALLGLPPGLYIVGKEKKVVTGE